MRSDEMIGWGNWWVGPDWMEKARRLVGKLVRVYRLIRGMNENSWESDLMKPTK